MDKIKYKSYLNSLRKQENDISENNMISKDDNIYVMAHTFNNISRSFSKIKNWVSITEKEHMNIEKSENDFEEKNNEF